MNTRRHLLLMAFSYSALSLLGLTAQANEATWPSKPVRIIVSGGNGSPTDIRARWLAERLAPGLGQPVVVENRPGAGGNMGTEAAARSAPDGYTLLMAHQGTMAVNPHLYARTGYDALTDFTAVARIGGSGPLLLAVAASSPVKSVAQLIALAKANPGGLSYGSTGIGTPPFLASELFKRSAGIDAIHVPYKAGGAMSTDMLAGTLSWTFEGAQAQVPHVKSGRARALAVSGKQRIAALPDVPTMAEAGLNDYEYIAWAGVVVPAATPKPIVYRLYSEIVKVLAATSSKEMFNAIGLSGQIDAPGELAALIQADHAKWGKIIREAGIKAE